MDGKFSTSTKLLSDDLIILSGSPKKSLKFCALVRPLRGGTSHTILVLLVSFLCSTSSSKTSTDHHPSIWAQQKVKLSYDSLMHIRHPVKILKLNLRYFRWVSHCLTSSGKKGTLTVVEGCNSAFQWAWHIAWSSYGSLNSSRLVAPLRWRWLIGTMFVCGAVGLRF